ncbi:MAG: ferritin family protein [Bacteroidota bacterium]|nr:ferritin family protein [Bacteroidota bacterium]
MKNKLLNILVIVSFVAIIIGCGQGNKKKEGEKNKTETCNKKTIENLRVALQGEVKESAQFAAFAKKAKEEKYPEIAKLFEAISKAEGMHASDFKDVLKELGAAVDSVKPGTFELKSTKENLEEAIRDESAEYKTKYPEFVKIAESDSLKNAVNALTWAINSEKINNELCKNALKALKSKKTKNLPHEYMICPKCGNIFLKGSKEENCGSCMSPNKNYKK